MHLLSFLWLLFFFSRISSCEDSFFWLLLNLSIKLIISSKCFDLISFLLFSDFLELLLGLLKLLLLYPIESLQLTLQVIEVSVFIHISFLESSKFLL